MPIFEYKCNECGKIEEYIIMANEQPSCRFCDSADMKKLVSAHASSSGPVKNRMPGPGDATCCGSSPEQASNCAGPGSCCGRNAL